MILAIVLVTAAVLSLVVILRIAVLRSLQVSADSDIAGQIEPIDVEAFRNLLNRDDDEYLRHRLPPAAFRLVRQARLRAVAAYVRVAGKNATLLVRMGEAALAAGDPRTTHAAQQLINEALLLRSNATLAILKIYVSLVGPEFGLRGTHIADGYARLSSTARLLGRLQNPAAPVRISASRL
jgi:hypothetical protein